MLPITPLRRALKSLGPSGPSGTRTSVRFMPRYTREQAEAAVRDSLNYSEALRKLGMRVSGGNHALLRHWVDDIWKIPTNHFDPDHGRSRPAFHRPAAPLDEVMVERSSYSRASLKRRLYDEGIKDRRCEMCGQGEIWQERRMALILDHANGVPDDHRMENLRILCPNCAATLDTHCGRKNLQPLGPRACLHCGGEFHPKDRRQRYCCRDCGTRWNRKGRAIPGTRRVVRPPRDVLLREIEETSYSAVGRKYGVSDNAIRKWVRFYENGEKASG